MSDDSLDLNRPEFYADPYPVYARLRSQRAPYYLASENAWLFTRYEDVAAMLKDPRITKQIGRPNPGPLDMSMLFQDPPTHQRLRGLVNQAFTRSRVQALSEQITRIADDLLDAVEAHGQMDLIAQFALLLPVRVISELLGVPEEERATFYQLSDRYVTAADGAYTEESMREQQAAMMALVACFTDLIERRRAEPQADLISALTQAHDVEDRLSTPELIGAAVLLLIAGHETTVNLLGSGMLCLLDHPDQFALLKQQPQLIETAIDEMLRYESPVQRGTFRIVTEPIQVAETIVEPGAQIWAIIGAANRDPEQFADPDRFDIARSPNRHLAFGYGIHYCLGASLARAEAQIGLERLLARLPGIRLASSPPARPPNLLLRALSTLGVGRDRPQPSPPQWRHSLMMRSLKALPVCWI
jgi:cytochrome P450